MTAVPLRPVEPEPVEQVINLLRDALKRAEIGEITDCIVILNTASEKEIEVKWTTNQWPLIHQLGALEWAKQAIVNDGSGA